MLPIKKIIVAIVSSNMCRICNLAEENAEKSPGHICTKNYDGSSKAMEVDAALTSIIFYITHQINAYTLKPS